MSGRVHRGDAQTRRFRRYLRRPENGALLETLQTCQELLEGMYGEPPCEADCECILHPLDALLGEAVAS